MSIFAMMRLYGYMAYMHIMHVVIYIYFDIEVY